MPDSDLLALLSEMLIKQDRQTEILTQFMEVSVRHFESELSFKNQQFIFNEEETRYNRQEQRFHEEFSSKLGNIERILARMLDLEERVKRIEDLLIRKAS